MLFFIKTVKYCYFDLVFVGQIKKTNKMKPDEWERAFGEIYKGR